MIHHQWLQTFLALVETGHFTRTAEKCCMTQPGVSQHIQKLEAQVGTPLLVREGKSFSLTRAGEALYRYGKRRVEEEASLLAGLAEDHPERGRLSIGCSGAMALFLYPELLQWQQQMPGLSSAVEAGPNARIEAQVLAGEMELGLVSRVPDSPRLAVQPLGRSSLSLVLPAEVESLDLNLERLQQLGFIDHPDGRYYLERVLGQGLELTPTQLEQIPVRTYINQINQILLPVAQGLGFTVLPSMAVARAQSPEQLQQVSIGEPVSEAVYLIHRARRPLPRRYQRLIELLQRHLASPED